ncbi:D-2-hydroxyacid dehydrogenase [Streptomyces blattellae]|uniref:D-2-hydroxyacid dehydrogenase n=1 Tax=Streptomyces blattellae TaxID=2569855 RepID=UPI001E40E4CE|nr:D-2-hydroxyacid dehydrogenase [Streptomyces blattellae]
MTTTVLVCLNSPYEFWNFGRTHAEGLHAEFPGVTFLAVPEADAPWHLSAADVYFGWSFLAHWIKDAPRLRWVATPSAGVDHLPVDALRTAGIGLTRGYGYHARPVTEHALGLLLGFSRGLFLSHRLQGRSRWWKDQIAESFFDLHGQTLAIVGCGEIGTRLGVAAQALGMHVIGVRRQRPQDDPLGIEWVPASRLHEALARSQAVVDLLPATDETRHLFDASAFAACRPGAVFLNLGRASTVDHAALLDALDSGHIAGAALDVPSVKPPPADDPLRHHPRVVLTPKSAVFSHDYMDRAVAFFGDNLRLHLDDRPLNGIVIPLPDGDRHVR